MVFDVYTGTGEVSLDLKKCGREKKKKQRKLPKGIHEREAPAKKLLQLSSNKVGRLPRTEGKKKVNEQR